VEVELEDTGRRLALDEVARIGDDVGLLREVDTLLLETANIPPGIVAMAVGIGKVKMLDAVEQQAKLLLSAGVASQQYSEIVGDTATRSYFGSSARLTEKGVVSFCILFVVGAEVCGDRVEGEEILWERELHIDG